MNSNILDNWKDNIEQEDLVYPYIKLIQNTTVERGDAHPGDIVNSNTFELVDTKLPFVILYWKKTYSICNPTDKKHPLFNKDYEPGATIVETTDPTVEQVNLCNNWTHGTPIGWVQYSFVVCSLEEVPQIFFLYLGKGTAKIAKKIITQIHRFVSPFDHCFTLAPLHVVEKERNFYRLKINWQGETPKSYHSDLIALFHQAYGFLNADVSESIDNGGEPHIVASADKE